MMIPASETAVNVLSIIAFIATVGSAILVYLAYNSSMLGS